MGTVAGCSVSMGSRPGSVSGEPIKKVTGPCKAIIVSPCELTHHCRRVSVFWSIVGGIVGSGCFQVRSNHSAAACTPLFSSVRKARDARAKT